MLKDADNAHNGDYVTGVSLCEDWQPLNEAT